MSEKKLRVIIVGAGFAGLTAGIECKLRGMEPIIVEYYPTSRSQGDMIDFLPNGGRIFNKWENGEVGKRLLQICLNSSKKLKFYNHRDELMVEERWNKYPHHYDKQFAGHRGEIHQTIMDYAREVGVELRFGEKVTQYLDSESEIGVVTSTGKKILGDVVLACDGPRSLARSQVLNLPDSRVNSGYAIYRAYYEITDEMRKNPNVMSFTDPKEDQAVMWVGPDIHGFVYSWRGGRDLAWVLTHKDDHDIGESWSFPGNVEDVLKDIDIGHFPERWKDMVKATPENRLIDYKLVWRDPLETWLSKSKRTAVMGDAAHCHLPTSAQGGCQALEDAVTVAVCLEKAKGDIPLALQVFERIRYNRSHVIHQSSVSIRDTYHRNDFNEDFLEKFPGAMTIPRPDWVLEFDAEKNAEDHFDQLAADVRSGKAGALKDLALPAGGSYDSYTPELILAGAVLDEHPLAKADVVPVNA